MKGQNPFFPIELEDGAYPGIAQRDVCAFIAIHALLSRPDIRLFDTDETKANVNAGDVAEAGANVADWYEKARALT